MRMHNKIKSPIRIPPSVLSDEKLQFFFMYMYDKLVLYGVPNDYTIY